MNGSWQLDNIVHNTTWIPGHFHITVGKASTMTFMGIAFWMLPHVSGRWLLSRRLALAATWLWFIGMSVFALGMHWAGLYGVPRRTWLSYLPHSVYERVYGLAHVPLALVGVGGTILWAAAACFYVVFFDSLFTGRLAESVAIPFTRAFGDDHAPSPMARVLDHVGLLTLLTALVTAAAYIPILKPFLTHPTAAPGWKVW